MQELRFDGPGHRLLVPGHDPIPLGMTGKFADDEAAALLAQDWLNLTIVNSAPPPSASKTAWQQHAASLGIDTEGLTRDQIIAAVENHGAHEQVADDGGDQPEPEAETGEGHNDEEIKE